MDEESARVFLPPRERCFDRLRLARFGETVTCVHCESEAVVKRGTTDKEAQQYWCKECETYFNDLTDTIFGQHRFGLEEMFYIVKEMRSEPSASTLQEEASADEFFNLVATETIALFEHLEFDFLEEFDVFAPAHGGRTRVHHPPELFRAFLHCYYKDIYGVRPVARELQNTIVWFSCGFDRPPSRDAVDRFLTDLEHVVDEVFERLVEQAARRGLLDLTYCIDSTDVRAIPADPDASKCYDPTAEEYYYGYGCTIVSTGSKIPIAAEFTESKQAPEETAMCVTRDALAVARPTWMVGDSAYDTLDWHDHLLAAGVVPVAPYNPRNTDEPLDIEYRVEDRIEEHSEDVHLKQSMLEETYNRRTQVERTNKSVKDCGLGTLRARGRVHTRAQVFLALCLRLVVAITNYECGDNPGSTIITV